MRKTNLNILAATICGVSAFLAIDQAGASGAAETVSIIDETSVRTSTDKYPAAPPVPGPEITREMRGRADMDGNGEFTVMDLALMLMHWGNCELRSADPCPGDINADGAVDEADLSIMLTLIGLSEIPVINFPETK